MAQNEFLDIEGAKALIQGMEKYVDDNKSTIINCTFEVDDKGNLVVVTPDGEEAPQGFSIDENGYLIFNEEV